jgi:hypothetical protein
MVPRISTHVVRRYEEQTMRKERSKPAHQQKHYRSVPTEVMFIVSLVLGGFRDLAVSLTADVLKHFIYLDRLLEAVKKILI